MIVGGNSQQLSVKRVWVRDCSYPTHSSIPTELRSAELVLSHPSMDLFLLVTIIAGQILCRLRMHLFIPRLCSPMSSIQPWLCNWHHTWVWMGLVGWIRLFVCSRLDLLPLLQSQAAIVAWLRRMIELKCVQWLNLHSLIRLLFLCRCCHNSLTVVPNSHTSPSVCYL